MFVFMVRYCFFLCVVFVHTAVLFAQDNNIHQKWIWQNKTDCKGENLTNSKWNVEFKRDNKALYSIDRSVLKGESVYSIQNKELSMNETIYQIEKLNNDSLILSLNNCEKVLFVSKNRLLEKQSKKFFKYKGDTIYFNEDYNSPIMIGYADYMQYINSKLPGKNQMEGECLIKLQFIVRKDGRLTDARGEIGCHKKSEKTIEKLMKDMAGQWKPMYLNKEAVNTLLRIKIDYSGTVIR